VEIVKVEVPERVTEVGLNDAVAPAGSPDTWKLVGVERLDTAATVMVWVELLPAVTLAVGGAAVIVKSGVTVKVAGIDTTRLPLVPVMVKAKLPDATPEPTVSVSVTLPDALVDDGLKAAVTPAGRLAAFNVTVEW